MPWHWGYCVCDQSEALASFPEQLAPGRAWRAMNLGHGAGSLSQSLGTASAASLWSSAGLGGLWGGHTQGFTLGGWYSRECSRWRRHKRGARGIHSALDVWRVHKCPYLRETRRKKHSIHLACTVYVEEKEVRVQKGKKPGEGQKKLPEVKHTCSRDLKANADRQGPLQQKKQRLFFRKN